jgi:hypothetical protein
MKTSNAAVLGVTAPDQFRFRLQLPVAPPTQDVSTAPAPCIAVRLAITAAEIRAFRRIKAPQDTLDVNM